VIETPQYGLTIFKVHFGALTLKGYTKGEHVLRFDWDDIAQRTRDIYDGLAQLAPREGAGRG